MNTLAFAANTAAGQYMTAQSHSMVSVLSQTPSSGSAGSTVQFKISSQYDIMAMSTTTPYVSVYFGSQKCHANVTKDSLSQGGPTYIISTEAPQFMVTNYRSPNNVPLALLIEGSNGEELARIEGAGSFTYHEAADAEGVGVESAGDGSAPESITRKQPLPPRSPEQHESPPQLTVRTSATNSPSQTHHPLSADSSTNTYGYPPAVGAVADAAVAAAAAAAQAQVEAQVQAQHNNFAAAAANFNQDGTMLGAYRSSSFTDHYPRAHPPSLRTPLGGWTTYGGLGHERYGTHSRPASISHSHTSITRPALTPSLPAPHGAAPQLMRTSCIPSGSPGSSSGMGVANAYNPWPVYPTKAVLTIAGNLDAMAQDWTTEEWNNKRRIVLFRKKQNGSHLEMTFRPVPVGERPSNSICISCIYWAEKNECFVTSVDTIYLLEQLVAHPLRFTVEEKNRIRRNLEGFKPLTVSKSKQDSEEFFKVIMGFGNPKPRNIEKDVKVFPWKILDQALKKIISKYSASPSSTQPPSTPTHLLTPVSLGGSYHALPATPGSTTTATDPSNATGYVSMASHATESVSSPRSLSGINSWGAYPPSSRSALSPTMKPHASPPPSLRMSGLPSTYDGRSTHSSSISSTYGLPLPTQGTTHHLGSAAPVTHAHAPHNTRWDSYDVTAGTGAYSTHHTGGQLYGGGYGDASQRA
jgi:hypothetical protein